MAECCKARKSQLLWAYGSPLRIRLRMVSFGLNGTWNVTTTYYVWPCSALK